MINYAFELREAFPDCKIYSNINLFGIAFVNLNNPKKLFKMRNKAKEYKKPLAALEIINIISDKIKNKILKGTGVITKDNVSLENAGKEAIAEEPLVKIEINTKAIAVAETAVNICLLVNFLPKNPPDKRPTNINNQ